MGVSIIGIRNLMKSAKEINIKLKLINEGKEE